MRETLAAAALAALAFADPASAVTFPTLTTIYVEAGVRDNGSLAAQGIATVFLCSNVSGQSADLRVLILDHVGAFHDQFQFNAMPHGATATMVTQGTNSFANELDMGSTAVGQGVVNIEATQSAIFCSAMIVDAGDARAMAPLNLVRVNAHPGTVE